MDTFRTLEWGRIKNELSEFDVSAELAQTAKIVEGLINPNAKEKVEKIIPKDLEDGSENPKGWGVI